MILATIKNTLMIAGLTLLSTNVLAEEVPLKIVKMGIYKSTGIEKQVLELQFNQEVSGGGDCNNTEAGSSFTAVLQMDKPGVEAIQKIAQEALSNNSNITLYLHPTNCVLIYNGWAGNRREIRSLWVYAN